MRTPDFWYPVPDAAQTGGDLRRMALAPLGTLYAAATARRVRRAPDIRPGCPVICVGNINAGGTGKTPTVIALTDLLRSMGRTPIVVTRGYGGSAQGPLLVDPGSHAADMVGDEPLLIAAFGPVIVAKDRAAGAAMAQDHGDVILLDDGHQNPGVAKDLSLVIVDAARGFGNGAVIPAGPLREPIPAGLARADALVSLGTSRAQDHFAQRWGEHVSVPHLTAKLDILPTGMPWQGMRAMAFAGIAHPKKFFDTLEGLGVTLMRAEALGDHQPLTTALMKRLEIEAQALGAQLVTTEKDAVRLPDSFRARVLTLPVRLRFDDEAALTQLIQTVL
ncbi:MAG: tetraacyldisaccharide 4'-kinase [Pseudomonadota bacterium]